MFDIALIVRFLSLLFFTGMIISSTTGFIFAASVSSRGYEVSLVTGSLVIFIQSLFCLMVEIFRLYDGYEFLYKNIFYIRSAIILQLSILSIGLTDVGIGFGIFGFIIFIINLLTGVFTDNYALKTRPYDHIKPNTTSSDDEGNFIRHI